MNFLDLANKDIENILETKDIKQIYDYIYENNIPLIRLYGEQMFPVLCESGEYYIIGEDYHSGRLKNIINYIEENYEDEIIQPNIINENLAQAKFKYTNYKHDPRPNILVLDNDYIYNGKGKVVKGQHDILGFNLHYSNNKKIDKKIIDEITTLAHQQKKNKLDIYESIKTNFPEALEYIRHYKPQYMQKLKMRPDKGWFWKKCSVADLSRED